MLGVGQIYLTLMIDGVGSVPFSAETIPPIEPPPVSYRDDVIRNSRAQFSLPRAQMEALISKRQQDFSMQKKKDKKREEPAKQGLGPHSRSVEAPQPLRGEASRVSSVSASEPAHRAALRAAIAATRQSNSASENVARTPIEILRARKVAKDERERLSGAPRVAPVEVPRDRDLPVQKTSPPPPRRTEEAPLPGNVSDEARQTGSVSDEISYEELQRVLQGEKGHYEEE